MGKDKNVNMIVKDSSRAKYTTMQHEHIAWLDFIDSKCKVFNIDGFAGKTFCDAQAVRIWGRRWGIAGLVVANVRSLANRLLGVCPSKRFRC